MGAESDIDIDALIGPPGDAVGATELADFLGLSTRTVRELAERGVIRRCGKNRFPMRESIRAYCASLRETAAARSSTGTQAVERLRWEKSRAESQEMKNAAMLRQLVPTAEVERAWACVGRPRPPGKGTGDRSAPSGASRRDSLVMAGTGLDSAPFQRLIPNLCTGVLLLFCLTAIQIA